MGKDTQREEEGNVLRVPQGLCFLQLFFMSSFDFFLYLSFCSFAQNIKVSILTMWFYTHYELIWKLTNYGRNATEMTSSKKSVNPKAPDSPALQEKCWGLEIRTRLFWAHSHKIVGRYFNMNSSTNTHTHIDYDRQSNYFTDGREYNNQDQKGPSEPKMQHKKAW